MADAETTIDAATAERLHRERETNLARNQVAADEEEQRGSSSSSSEREERSEAVSLEAQARAELTGMLMLAQGCYTGIGVTPVPDAAGKAWIEACTPWAAKSIEEYGEIPHFDAVVAALVTLATFGPPTKAAYKKLRYGDEDEEKPRTVEGKATVKA